MDNSKVNKLLNQKYSLIQDIAKKYDYNEELICMLTFAYIGFIMELGKDSDFVIYDVLNKVKTIYEEGTLNDISQRNNFGTMPSGSVAVTIFEPNLKVFDDETLKQKPQTIILGSNLSDEVLATPILRLEMLVHELRHALTSYHNTNKLLDPTTYYMRSGFQETFYTKKSDSKDNISEKRFGCILDEVINTFGSERIINKILHLKGVKIDNKNLREYLNTIKTSQQDQKYRALGYNSEIRLMYPLLLNDTFFSLVNEKSFTGELEEFKELISNTSTEISYETFCLQLDAFHNASEKYKRLSKSGEILTEEDKMFAASYINNINQLKQTILAINNSFTTQDEVSYQKKKV